MTWLKLDDGWQSHPKMQRIGPLGRELWLAGALYAARHLTDGLIDKSALTMLAGAAGVKPSHATALVELGLWHDRGDHYEIHDYLDYNPSLAEVEKKREEGSERQRKSRESRVTNTVTDSATNAVTSRDPSTTRPLSINISTTTSPSYPDEVVVVLNAILESEFADQNPSAITNPSAWRAKVYGRIRDEWGAVFTEALAALPADGETTLFELADQVSHVHHHGLWPAILSRLADMEITCTPPTPSESAPDSRPSGPPDDGAEQPSRSGANGSSTTTSPSQNEPSNASVTDIGSSRRSRTGSRPTALSVAPTTPTPETTGKALPTVDEPSSPTSKPTSPTGAVPSGPAFLGAEMAKNGVPRSTLDPLIANWPADDQAEAVAAYRAALPERRRYESDVWQVDHVRAEDGQVFTVKVHQNGHVTGLRADFPAAVWRDAEVVEA